MNKINIYTLPRCPQCAATRAYFEKQNLPYEEKDATRHVQRWQSLGFTTAPIVEILSPQGQTIDMWAGFQPSRIKNYACKNTVPAAAPQPYPPPVSTSPTM